MAKIKVGIFMELVKNPELKVPLIKRKKKIKKSHTDIHPCVRVSARAPRRKWETKPK